MRNFWLGSKKVKCRQTFSVNGQTEELIGYLAPKRSFYLFSRHWYASVPPSETVWLQGAIYDKPNRDRWQGAWEEVRDRFISERPGCAPSSPVVVSVTYTPGSDFTYPLGTATTDGELNDILTRELT